MVINTQNHEVPRVRAVACSATDGRNQGSRIVIKKGRKGWKSRGDYRDSVFLHSRPLHSELAVGRQHAQDLVLKPDETPAWGWEVGSAKERLAN